jgi:pimeloyl-ACP methyl ester carboxylesterase
VLHLHPLTFIYPLLPQDALKLPACHFVALDFGTPMALQLAISHPNRVLSLFMLSQTCLEEPPNVVDAWKELYIEWGDSFLGPNEVDAERMHDSGYGFADYMFSNHLTNLGQA